MIYKPKVGDDFKIEGTNISGEVMQSENKYHCVQQDTIICVGTNKGLEFKFRQHKSIKHFRYVKVG